MVKTKQPTLNSVHLRFGRVIVESEMTTVYMFTGRDYVPCHYLCTIAVA